MDVRRKMLMKKTSSGGSGDDYNYMTIYALENGLQAKLSGNTVSYSIDEGNTWTSLSSNTYTPTVNSGQTIMFKASLTPTSSKGVGTFTINKQCNLTGNCMSLLFGDDAASNNSLSGKDSAFYKLFNGCTTIVEVSSTFLPATTLASKCYRSMFRGCTSLINSPELPAITLASNCYYSMFQDCTSLTTAPELPAITLASQCYDSMFRGCTSLINSPELPAITLASQCYDSMFYGTNVLPDCSNIDFSSNTIVSSCGLYGLFSGTKVTDADLFNILPINPSTGKYWLPATTLASNCYYSMFYNCTSLTTAPELPATTLASQCYYSMFQDCTSLTTAPELPATTLAISCYAQMFYNCYSLTTTPVLPATILASSCYLYMFYNCTSLTTAPAVLPATTLANDCYNRMFQSCSKLTTAPELPAITLASQCYRYMFYGCSKLNYIKALFTTTPSTSYTDSWVNGVSSTGTFVKHPNMTSLPSGNSGIPSGWTVVDDN